MDVRDAEAFIAVAEELHFGRAATRLRIAQPPLSRHIKQLEQQLGAELFDRSTRHFTLTAAGSALLGPARELVATADQAVEAVKNLIAGTTGSLRIGFAGASTYRRVGELAKQVRQHYPQLNLEFDTAQFSDLGLQRVLDEELDMTIGRWERLPEGIDSRIITLEQITVLLPDDHHLAVKPSVDILDLADEPWIGFPADPRGATGSALTNRLKMLALNAGFFPKISRTAPDVWTQCVLVLAGMGCAFSVDSVESELATDTVVSRPITEATEPLEVRLIWKESNQNPALSHVVSIAEQLFPNPALCARTR